MIASLSEIVYIAFVKSEPCHFKIKQYWKFSNVSILPIIINSDDSDFDDNGEALQELKQNYVYHIIGKFALVEDDITIIDIVITTSKS